MSEKTIAILLIEDDSEYADLVQHWLSGGGSAEFVLNWADSLEAGLKRLERGGIDVILLDLGLPDSSGYETFERTRAAASSIPIILLSSVDSQSVALRMIQGGAQDYLLKSTCSGEALARTIRYAIVRHEHSPRAPGENPESEARVFGVIGAKGGVGATSVACSLALELRRQTLEETALLDLDLDGGHVSFLMQAEGKFSILDAVKNLHRLDPTYWDALVVKNNENLHIASSQVLHGVTEVDPERLRLVLKLIRTSYRWMVLDLGRLNKLSLSLLEQQDEICLITSTTIPALFEVKRIITSLVGAGLDRNRLRLIVNHLTPKPEIPSSELSGLFGVPVDAVLPEAANDFRDFNGVYRLPSENSRFRKSIAGLARKLAGLSDDKPKSVVSRLASLSQRFRREQESRSTKPDLQQGA